MIFEAKPKELIGITSRDGIPVVSLWSRGRDLDDLLSNLSIILMDAEGTECDVSPGDLDYVFTKTTIEKIHAMLQDKIIDECEFLRDSREDR